MKDHKFDLSDCPVVEARPCAKCEKQQQMLETMAEGLETIKLKAGNDEWDDEKCASEAWIKAHNILTTYKQFMEGK